MFKVVDHLAMNDYFLLLLPQGYQNWRFGVPFSNRCSITFLSNLQLLALTIHLVFILLIMLDISEIKISYGNGGITSTSL